MIYSVWDSRTWGEILLSGVQNRVRGNGQRHRKFHSNMRKNFTVRVMERCNRLPREFVESSFLEIVKTHLDTFLCNLV